MNHYTIEGIIAGRACGAAEHSSFERARSIAERTYQRGWYDVVRVVDRSGSTVFALGVASRVGGRFIGDAI